MHDGRGRRDVGRGDLQSLLDALKALSEQGKNLIVKSPDPLGISELWQAEPGEPLKKVGIFVSALGTRVEPLKHYQVRVLLDPVFTFNDVVVQPKEIKILEVKGKGHVTIEFGNELFAVSLLDEHGRQWRRFRRMWRPRFRPDFTR